MWLIDTRTLKLCEFVGADNIPQYAILSHTWGDDEVTFQDMTSPVMPLAVLEAKKGYTKIARTCHLARFRDCLRYAWVDTCCIDKSSSAELTESINSMYQWYADAAVCYVFLQDFEPGATPSIALKSCRWFTRGWTLQELLAPETLIFLDRQWNQIGTKLHLIEDIHDITNIGQAVLRGAMKATDCSVAQRMAWASSRKTTRVEDTAYCLMGLFQVHMPLIYGEGRMAFRRLQEEIIKRSNDLTIFAWETQNEPSSADADHYRFTSIFAKSPDLFTDPWTCVSPGTTWSDFPEFAVTNTGLMCSAGLRLEAWTLQDKPWADNSRPWTPQDRSGRYMLPVGFTISDKMMSVVVAVPLLKIAPGIFARDRLAPLAKAGGGELYNDTHPGPEVVGRGRTATSSTFHILTDAAASLDLLRLLVNTPLSLQRFMSDAKGEEHREHTWKDVKIRSGLHIPIDMEDLIELQAVEPEHLWNISDRVVYEPPDFASTGTAIVLSFKIKFMTETASNVTMVVVLEHGKLSGLSFLYGKEGSEQTMERMRQKSSPIGHWNPILCQVLRKEHLSDDQLQFFDAGHKGKAFTLRDVESQVPGGRDSVDASFYIGKLGRLRVFFNTEKVPGLTAENVVITCLKFEVQKNMDKHKKTPLTIEGRLDNLKMSRLSRMFSNK